MGRVSVLECFRAFYLNVLAVASVCVCWQQGLERLDGSEVQTQRILY